MNTLLIARNTFREAARDRVLAGVLAAGLVLLAATQVLGLLALGEGRRLTVDLGLSGVSILGLMVVLLVGTSLVAKELERRTIFNLLSRPIARSSYLVGKWLGLSSALWVLAGFMSLALCLVLATHGAGSFAPGVAEAAYLTGLELMVVTALAVLFSALSTPVLSALYTLGFYLVGQWSYDLRSFGEHLPTVAGRLVGMIADLAPNLPLFNARAIAAGGHLTSLHHLGFATLYALLYAGCVLSLATAAFESRDFK